MLKLIISSYFVIGFSDVRAARRRQIICSPYNDKKFFRHVRYFFVFLIVTFIPLLKMFFFNQLIRSEMHLANKRWLFARSEQEFFHRYHVGLLGLVEQDNGVMAQIKKATSLSRLESNQQISSWRRSAQVATQRFKHWQGPNWSAGRLIWCSIVFVSDHSKLVLVERFTIMNGGVRVAGGFGVRLPMSYYGIRLV